MNQLMERDRDIDSLKRQVEETNNQFDKITEDYQQLQVSILVVNQSVEGIMLRLLLM